MPFDPEKLQKKALSSRFWREMHIPFPPTPETETPTIQTLEIGRVQMKIIKIREDIISQPGKVVVDISEAYHEGGREKAVNWIALIKGPHEKFTSDREFINIRHYNEMHFAYVEEGKVYEFCFGPKNRRTQKVEESDAHRGFFKVDFGTLTTFSKEEAFKRVYTRTNVKDEKPTQTKSRFSI